MSEPVKPALTPREWQAMSADISGAATIFAGKHGLTIVNDDYYAGYTEYLNREHAIAALALHDQPFGFTQRDVNNIRAITEGWPVARPEELHAALRSLAARIAALLPPE